MTPPVARVSLLDVNVLVALVSPDHVHHEIAHDWFADHRDRGWATCPLTENGFVRVVSQLAAGEAAMRPSVVLDLLRRFCADRRHTFWPDAISLRDTAAFDHSLIRGPRQVTDVYLLGLARKMHGRLVTFDATIPVKAVAGATPDHLCVIAAAEEA